MLQQVENHINVNMSFLKGKRLLLATSGGIDSVVMTNIFHKLGYDIALAHCNFNLRGKESDEDESFVKNSAAEYGICCFTTSFDTTLFASDYKISIQVAARELRYKWFYELLNTHGYEYLLTAHQADDNLETFLINLSRGTGIEGLTGIPKQNNKIVRPLLPFSRGQILKFASDNKLQWREDSSNSSAKYIRNKIRLEIIPLLKELNPQLLESFALTQDFLQQTQLLAEDAAILVYQRVAKDDGEQTIFDLTELKKLPNFHSYLFQWLREYGFTAWEDIYTLAASQSGKQVFSATHGLLKDREKFILYPLKKSESADVYLIKKGTLHVNFPVKLDFITVDRMTATTNKVIFADADKLQFPLQMRRWHEGDIFYPFGMEGKSKKIGKFFKDEKLSLLEKQQVWLLCSGNSIIWVIGYRQDERFKIYPTTTNILQIALNE